jgi:ABC-type branched-subunit amino acid transport system substrate-binding protein
MRILFILFLSILVACSGVKNKHNTDEANVSEVVRTKLAEAREFVRTGQHKPALAKLSELNDNTISPLEKSLKYNLKGVTLFNFGEVDKALLNFEVAEKYAPKDTQLFSQLQLNMASAHYKLGHFNELKICLDKIDKKQMVEGEKKKYAQLTLAYGQKFKNNAMIVSGSLDMLAEAKTLAEVTGSNLYEPMKTSFQTLSEPQKIALLEEYNESKNLAVAQLAEVEADARYTKGDKSGAKDVISWLKSQYSDNAEVEKFIQDFGLRIENSGLLSVSDIGVILPLTGDKAQFGQKALSGVDTGLKVLGMNETVTIHTKDTADSPAQGAQAVLDLIKEKKVAFIIGGLFPESAKAEYLEARKYGVLYISLSQVNLPKEEKNHHLIEVQGSIESQVETLLSDEMIKKFGTRLGVIYPENEGGKAYMDEIWRKSLQKNLKVSSIATFPKNTHDYRDTSQLFLGLKYPRERSEELNILDDVYALEKSSIRRVQTLPPVLDFDWVFLASFPHEAAQLIPTLGYYDATRMKVIGGPSWVSNSMVKEQKNLGTLFFVGDDPKEINQSMLNRFKELYGRPASLIEILALDAMKIGSEALTSSGQASDREAFDAKMKSQGQLKGLSTVWDFKEGVWIKKMNAMTITHGEIVKLF